MLTRNEVVGEWVFQFKKELYDWERVEVTRMLALLEATPAIKSETEDKLVWTTSKIGIFTILFMYNFLTAGFGTPLSSSKLVWVKYIPPSPPMESNI